MQAVLLMMMALLLLNNCSVKIKDDTFCDLIPGDRGAVCDNFLTKHPQTLNQAQWIALQNRWNAEGNAVACTTSGYEGDLKAEIEKLCSQAKCDYQTKMLFINGLTRMEKTADLARLFLK